MSTRDLAEASYYDAFLFADLEETEALSNLIAAYPNMVREGQRQMEEAEEQTIEAVETFQWIGASDRVTVEKDFFDEGGLWAKIAEEQREEQARDLKQRRDEAANKGDFDYAAAIDEEMRELVKAPIIINYIIDDAAAGVKKGYEEVKAEAEKDYGGLLGLLFPMLQFLFGGVVEGFFNLLYDILPGRE